MTEYRYIDGITADLQERFPILTRLDDERIFMIEWRPDHIAKLPSNASYTGDLSDGKDWWLSERCDEHFVVQLTKTELLALAEEIKQVAELRSGTSSIDWRDKIEWKWEKTGRHLKGLSDFAFFHITVNEKHCIAFVSTPGPECVPEDEAPREFRDIESAKLWCATLVKELYTRFKNNTPGETE